MFNFFKKAVFGLDISDFSIEALQLASKNKVKAFGRVLLEEDTVKDGKILNKEKLVQKIKEVISESGIKSKRVILSLPESKTFIHFFSEEGNINIEEEATKVIPWGPEEVYFDAKDGLYVAAPKNIVDDYLEVLKEVGLRLVALDTESLALGRSLEARKCLVADIGARTTNLSIFDEAGNLRISASVSVAGNIFSQTIAEKLDVSLKDAEKLKEKCGLDEEKAEGRIMLVLQKEIQPIIEEIKKVINFYSKEIGEIFLAGGSAQMPEITSYFSSNLNLKVVIGKSPITKQLKTGSILFNTVIGSALRGMERAPEKAGINLVPRKEKTRAVFAEGKTKKPNKSKIFSFSVVGFVITSLLFLGWVIYAYIFKGQ